MKNCLFVLIMLLLAGCSTSEQLAKNLNGKDISGSGFFTKSKIGLDTDTMTPAIDTLFVSGNFKTVKAGTNFIDIIQEKSASVFNAEAETIKKHITISCSEKSDFQEVIKLILEKQNEN